MKAILRTQYGPPERLQLVEVEKPEPKDHQVLVKVHAASANALDWRPFTIPILIRLLDGGLLKPKDPKMGADIAGTVEAVGGSVTEFKPGDAVFGVCGGSFAEYALAGESKLAHKPANLSFEQAAAVPVAAFTALQGDAVFGVCGGSFAEYALAGESKLAHKPANLSFEQAAAVPVAAFTALQGLRDKGR